MARSGPATNTPSRLLAAPDAIVRACDIVYPLAWKRADPAPHRERLRDRPCDASATGKRPKANERIARCQTRTDVLSDDQEVYQCPPYLFRVASVRRSTPSRRTGRAPVASALSTRSTTGITFGQR